MDTGTNSSLPGDVLDRISGMEKIFDEAQEIVHSLEQAIAAYKDFLPEIQKLEAYYTSRQWKDDFALDEAGKLPVTLKRGVLSEDGIYNLLEQNRKVRTLIS